MLTVQKRWQTEVDCHKLEQEAKRDARKIESYETEKRKLDSQVLSLTEKIHRLDEDKLKMLETINTAKKENDILMEQEPARWAEERASLLAENARLKIGMQQQSQERERERNTSQIDEKPLLEVFAMRDDALDGLPDSIKGDIDLHTKHCELKI
jgi:hypothetical protein